MTETTPSLKAVSPMRHMLNWLTSQSERAYALGKRMEAEHINGHISVAKALVDKEEEFAIEFLKYYNKTATIGFYSTGENHGKTLKEIYQEFLKSKILQ